VVDAKDVFRFVTGGDMDKDTDTCLVQILKDQKMSILQTGSIQASRILLARGIAGHIFNSAEVNPGIGLNIVIETELKEIFESARKMIGEKISGN